MSRADRSTGAEPFLFAATPVLALYGAACLAIFLLPHQRDDLDKLGRMNAFQGVAHVSKAMSLGLVDRGYAHWYIGDRPANSEFDKEIAISLFVLSGVWLFWALLLGAAAQVTSLLLERAPTR